MVLFVQDIKCKSSLSSLNIRAAPVPILLLTCSVFLDALFKSGENLCFNQPIKTTSCLSNFSLQIPFLAFHVTCWCKDGIEFLLCDLRARFTAWIFIVEQCSRMPDNVPVWFVYMDSRNKNQDKKHRKYPIDGRGTFQVEVDLWIAGPHMRCPFIPLLLSVVLYGPFYLVKIMDIYINQPWTIIVKNNKVYKRES